MERPTDRRSGMGLLSGIFCLRGALATGKWLPFLRERLNAGTDGRERVDPVTLQHRGRSKPVERRSKRFKISHAGFSRRKQAHCRGNATKAVAIRLELQISELRPSLARTLVLHLFDCERRDQAKRADRGLRDSLHGKQKAAPALASNRRWAGSLNAVRASSSRRGMTACGRLSEQQRHDHRRQA